MCRLLAEYHHRARHSSPLLSTLAIRHHPSPMTTQAAFALVYDYDYERARLEPALRRASR